MKLQTKLQLSLAVVFIIAIITIGAVLKVTDHEEVLIGQSQSNQLQKSIEVFMLLESKKMEEFVLEYAVWNELSVFVQGKHTSWIEQNMQNMLQRFNVNALLFFDESGNIVYRKSMGLNVDFMSSIDTVTFFNCLRKNKTIHTFTMKDSLLIEVQGASIQSLVDTSRASKLRGYVVVAKPWDANCLKRMEPILNSKLSIERQKTKTLNEIHKSTLSIFYPVIDWRGKLVTCIRSEKSIEAIGEYKKITSKLIYILSLSAFILLLVFGYSIAVWVNNPLRIIELLLINKQMHRVNELRLYGKEFWSIGQLIKKTFVQKCELNKAKAYADHSNDLKRVFLRNISHEIRTPLNGIIGFSEMLSDQIDEKTRLQYVKIIKKCSNELTKTIEEIIEASKIETDGLRLIKVQFSLNECMTNLLKQFNDLAVVQSKGNISIVLNINPNLKVLKLYTDRMQLQRILQILVGNALKFTSNGFIELGADFVSSGDICIYVKDTGIGISPDKLEIIFDHFRQADERNARLYGGLGLGLTICKGLVTKLGGTLWVKSELNHGSTFYFTIPSSQITKSSHIKVDSTLVYCK
jgi:signal transduction histidine kinase